MHTPIGIRPELTHSYRHPSAFPLSIGPVLLVASYNSMYQMQQNRPAKFAQISGGARNPLAWNLTA